MSQLLARYKNRGGFSLLEILLATGIFISLLLLMTSLLTQIVRQSREFEPYQLASLHGQEILTRLRQDLLASRALVTEIGERQQVMIPAWSLERTGDNYRLIINQVTPDQTSANEYRLVRQVYQGQASSSTSTQSGQLTLTQERAFGPRGESFKLSELPLLLYEELTPSKSLLSSRLTLSQWRLIAPENLPKAGSTFNQNITAPYLRVELALSQLTAQGKLAGMRWQATLANRQWGSHDQAIQGGVTDVSASR